MSAYPPPTIGNDLQFNPNNFESGLETLTISSADQRYLKKNNGVGSNLFITDQITFSTGPSIITNTEAAYLTSITKGTASASKALVVDASRNITNIALLTTGSIVSTSIILGGATLTNTQANYLTSITPGTAAASKALVLDSSRNISNVNVFTASELTMQANLRFVFSGSTNYIQSGLALSAGSSADLFVGNVLNTFNGSTRALMMKGGTGKVAIQGYAPTKQLDINSATGDCLRLMYNSNFDGTGVNYSDFTVSSDGNLTITSSGGLVSIGNLSITGTTTASSTTTGCLVLSGGLGAAKMIYGTQLTLSNSTSHIFMVNGAQNALIEVPSSPDMLRLVRGYAVNIGTSGVNIGSASTRNPICPLDMGQIVNNMGISLYNDGTSYYGFSANNSATQYSSGGAHKWFTTCSTASPININTMSLESSGNLTILNNTIAKSYFATGFSSIGLTGSGTKIHWSGTIGEIFAYDYTGAVYKDLKLGNGLYIAGPSGYCGIGTSSVSFPFVVLSSIASSIAGPYGYLSDLGAGVGMGTGSVSVSAYFAGRIFAKEIDCFSDERLKHNLVPINEDDAINFIKNVIPIEYEWRDSDGGARTGYSAQQLLKTGLFTNLVTSHINPDMKGETDADGFVSPKGRHFAIQYSNVVSILHKVIQTQQKRIERLEAILLNGDLNVPQGVEGQRPSGALRASDHVVPIQSKPAPTRLVKIKRKKRVII